jgi:HJR/Mrr/RecB family endonuclease
MEEGRHTQEAMTKDFSKVLLVVILDILAVGFQAATIKDHHCLEVTIKVLHLVIINKARLLEIGSKASLVILELNNNLPIQDTVVIKESINSLILFSFWILEANDSMPIRVSQGKAGRYGIMIPNRTWS